MTETLYSLDKVAIRMVKEPPIYSSTPVRSPDDAVRLMAEMLKGYDRDKKDTTTPTQDSSKSDDGTKKTTVKDNSGSSDDSGKGQSTPGSDGKGQSTQTTAPKTGDESNVTLWVILMLAAACAAGGFGIFAATKRRRRR